MQSKTSEFEKIEQLKLRKLSKREVDSMDKDINNYIRKHKEEAKQRETERWKPKKENIGTCFCGGNIILVTTYTSVFNRNTGPLIVGPDSRSQFSRVKNQKCFCEKCGIVYNKKIVKK